MGEHHSCHFVAVCSSLAYVHGVVVLMRTPVGPTPLTSVLWPQPRSSFLVARPGHGGVDIALQKTQSWPLVKSSRLSAHRCHPPTVPPTWFSMPAEARSRGIALGANRWEGFRG